MAVCHVSEVLALLHCLGLSRALGCSRSDMTAHQDFVLIKSLKDASDKIYSLSWSGHLLAAGGKDKQVRIYDSNKELGGPTARCVLLEEVKPCKKSYHRHPSTKKLRFQVPTGVANCAAQLGCQKLWGASAMRPQDFALTHTLTEATDWTRSVAFSGRLLAAGSRDQKIRLYDAEKEPGHSGLQGWLGRISG